MAKENKISNSTLVIVICMPLIIALSRFIQNYKLSLLWEIILILIGGAIISFSIAFIIIKFRKE